jgi:hypothetical protein
MQMTKLTWLGEDELHGGGAGPSFTTAFGGIKFPKGEPVEVADEAIVAKARNNQFFEVEAEDCAEDADEPDGLDDMKIAELREMAEARGIDHSDMSKADLRDVLRAGNVQNAG